MSKLDYRPCFLIPCYNHGGTVAGVLDSLASFNLPVFLVDDGSDKETKFALSEAAKRENVSLITLPKNQGKGGAVIAGIRHAHWLGYSHVIQIDADGQHDISALPNLIEASKTHPHHLISGQPVYDESVPKARLYGRYVTHIWVWIETLSLEIKDSMCGFRAYPVQAAIEVMNHNDIGSRMDFDTEIFVRMFWNGVQFKFVNTRVIYPENGISHFDSLWDNVKISWMHTRLFFGMLPRIPQLLLRKKNQDTEAHWSKRQERGTVLGIKVLMAVYKLLGRKVFRAILKLVMGYYHLTGRQAKTSSEQFLIQVKAFAEQEQLPLAKNLTSYNHLLSFGETMLDKLAAWRGDFNINNLTIHGQEQLTSLVEQKRGLLLLGSHLGNIELCRALSRRHTHLKINALVFTEHAERFNAVMKAVNPKSELNLIQVSKLGPDTAIMLQQMIERGEWVVIVGDRTSTSVESRVVWADFLGKPAPFPQGPFMLASVLEAPVYLIFGLRDDQSRHPHFDVYFEHFSDSIKLPRATRQQSLQQVVQQYADRLQHYTMKAPLQWYNFFNFWELSKNHDEDKRQ
ncbi:glycosyltransferase family 2 protein [Vibrio sp. Y2-5]|uniref:glycosyltransferase family 2 protein n=1 Tax=Vibrio sp. Y2-5 TaxID=2743977 RepID=UPI001660512F|nr:glycosyltransferase family 2 protein [Vibrio sp. Y2-5]